MRRLVLLILAVMLIASNAMAGVPGFMKARMGTLQGEVYVGGKILPSAIVSFFDKKSGPPPVMGTARRVPDMVSRTNDKGEFSVKLLPGSYYMGAMVREMGQGPGPPRKGEEYFFIRTDSGKLRLFKVNKKALSKVGKVEGVKPGEFEEFKDFITIQGVVADESGKPTSGIMVNLKDSLKSPRPRYVSDRTDENGKYELRVPPGKYYVMARESLRGGRPRTGSYIGTYGKTAPIGEAAPANAGGAMGGSPPGVGVQGGGGGGEAILVEGKGGEVFSDVNIAMFRIPDPVETRRKFEESARARELEDADVKKEKDDK